MRESHDVGCDVQSVLSAGNLREICVNQRGTAMQGDANPAMDVPVIECVSKANRAPDMASLDFRNDPACCESEITGA
jgi:hypothetical protein